MTSGSAYAQRAQRGAVLFRHRHRALHQAAQLRISVGVLRDHRAVGGGGLIRGLGSSGVGLGGGTQDRQLVLTISAATASARRQRQRGNDYDEDTKTGAGQVLHDGNSY